MAVIVPLADKNPKDDSFLTFARWSPKTCNFDFSCKTKQIKREVGKWRKREDKALKEGEIEHLRIKY